MKAYAIIVLISIALIGMPLTLGTTSNQETKEVKEVQLDYSHNTKYRVINNKIYKILDGGLYQDVKTGNIFDSRILEVSYSYSSFTF